MKKFSVSAGLAVATLFWAACGGSPEPPPPAPQPARAPVAAAPTTNADDAARRAREAEEAAARARREAEAARRATLAEAVYFDYDQSDIRMDSRAVLDRKARVLREVPTVRLRVEGHADERGSTEYNLALGSRRAAAVRDYLAGLGINATRMETTSYGESRPARSGQSESVWSLNRRAEFGVISGSLVSGQ